MSKRRYIWFIAVLTVAILALCGCGSTQSIKNQTDIPVQTSDAQASVTELPQNGSNEITDFEAHFIDVGQGDCILLRSEGESMLIDAGNNKDGDAVVQYLKNAGITSLDYIVGTHPDADHIGGLDVVINSLQIGKVYMPKKEHTTKTFEDVLLAVQNKGLKITAPKVGDMIQLGSASIMVMGPAVTYEDNNNNSIVLKVVHGKNSFLLTGDAELEAELDELSSGMDLSATVLKVGHHGSHSSTSKDFLEAVHPTYAVISCGVDNSYGHPHIETLNYLNEGQVEVYRTDLSQTIIMTSNGKEIDIETNAPSAIGSESGGSRDTTDVKKEETKKEDSSGNGSYIGNSNSKKFHIPTCNALPAEKNRVYFSTRNEAIQNNYAPCGKCNP